MATTKQIVLSGYYGFDNIGDEAVLFSILSLLKKEIPNTKIVVLSNNPEKTKITYGVESVNRWDIKTVAKVIKQSDILISGGGSLLQDVTSSKTIPYYLAIVKIAQFYKKKVVFYSQGIGPVNKSFSKTLMKMIINKVDGIYVREPGSKALLQEIGIKKPVEVSIDPVIGINLGREVKETKGAVQKPAVGIYLRPWQNEVHDENLLESMKEGLGELIAKGYKLYFIPMHYNQDREISKKLQDKLVQSGLGKASDIEVVDKMLSIEEVLDYTASFDMIIGMRLHSLIMAAAEKVPMMALSYDPKVTGFMKEIEQADYCIDSDKVTAAMFREKLEKLIDNKAQQKEELIKVFEAKKDKIYLPLNKVKELLK
ncbi:polysaccharide pyruvyl transferase CsaB [Cellulosilyticum ruminicola]|uniref:polysaccharide pyruvyl transferase CsaB n=1 Tax=Cellulosilyticum ruminicola TaxID=425254 RepID=UPI0006CFC128|nr:polysaccharide pyruvyl transferase CsaB [Cellulosilyticum ruminicola]